MDLITQDEKKKHRIAIPNYTLGEELISSISHGVGALFGVTALVLCIIKSVAAQDPWKEASSIVFGLTVIILYTMSCLYHALKVNKAKRVFRVFDHCTIFLLIAGTYTPFTLVTLRGTPWGWIIFGIIWGTAILGVVLNAVNLRKYSKISVACYLIMGWMIILAFRPMMEAMAWDGMLLLIGGGVAYSLGAILYGIGSKKRYFHSVFHFFCLAGTVLHFLAIYLYVL